MSRVPGAPGPRPLRARNARACFRTPRKGFIPFLFVADFANGPGCPAGPGMMVRQVPRGLSRMRSRTNERRRRQQEANPPWYAPAPVAPKGWWTPTKPPAGAGMVPASAAPRRLEPAPTRRLSGQLEPHAGARLVPTPGARPEGGTPSPPISPSRDGQDRSAPAAPDGVERHPRRGIQAVQGQCPHHRHRGRRPGGALPDHRRPGRTQPARRSGRADRHQRPVGGEFGSQLRPGLGQFRRDGDQPVAPALRGRRHRQDRRCVLRR